MQADSNWYRPLMEAIVLEHRGAEIPAGFFELADEMNEDPRCRLVVAGADGVGILLFSIWDGGVGAEVAAGVMDLGVAESVRLLTVPEAFAAWG